jgi:hypothetical protein
MTPEGTGKGASLILCGKGTGNHGRVKELSWRKETKADEA